jgi:hypothetical protein
MVPTRVEKRHSLLFRALNPAEFAQSYQRFASINFANR